MDGMVLMAQRKHLRNTRQHALRLQRGAISASELRPSVDSVQRGWSCRRAPQSSGPAVATVASALWAIESCRGPSSRSTQERLRSATTLALSVSTFVSFFSSESRAGLRYDHNAAVASSLQRIGDSPGRRNTFGHSQREHVDIEDSLGAKINAPSMMFRSSRALPGQSWLRARAPPNGGA